MLINCNNNPNDVRTYLNPPAGANPTSVADGQTSYSATCPGPPSWSGSVSASSAASTRGSLYAAANASGADVTSEAYAEFTNVLTFNPSLDDPLQAGTLIIGMRIDGRLKQLGWGQACIGFNFSDSACQKSPEGAADQASFVVTKGLALQGVKALTLSESLEANAPAQPDHTNASADFGRTAQTFVQLPPGWTFTSGSGDFLLNQIRVLQSGRCLDADTGSIGGNGTKVQLWDAGAERTKVGQ